MISRKMSQFQAPIERIFVGVAGGSAAGKTTLCQTIYRQMAFDDNFKVQIISLDSFYKSIDKDQIDVSEYNFDHPSALDFEMAFQVLNLLKYTNQPVAVPQYSFVEHKRLPESTYVNPANIILFEGLMAFHDERIRNLMTYKIFINCDDDIRLCRRIKRDTTQRGRTIQGVLKQYNRFVKTAFRDFIYPTVGYADLVIPGSRNNRISVDFIVQHIKNMAKKINIFEKASKTKIYLFGENQYYDKNVLQNYKTSIKLKASSFLIFPTSEEHKKQLDFFISSLMSEAFSQDYFEQIYVYQFLKTVRSLLRQLIELKNFERDDIELISIYKLNKGLVEINEKKKVKMFFCPFFFSNEASKEVLQKIKKIDSHQITIVIINLFCDMKFPNLIYECRNEGLIFLNLFLIANKRRFFEIMNSNNINQSSQVDIDEGSWILEHEQLLDRGIVFVSNQLGITDHKPITK